MSFEPILHKNWCVVNTLLLTILEHDNRLASFAVRTQKTLYTTNFPKMRAAYKYAVVKCRRVEAAIVSTLLCEAFGTARETREFNCLMMLKHRETTKVFGLVFRLQYFSFKIAKVACYFARIAIDKISIAKGKFVRVRYSGHLPDYPQNRI